MTISPTASKKNTPDKKGKLGFLNSFSPSLCSTRILKHLDSLRAFSDADARENTRNNQASEKASSWFHEQPPRYSGGAGVPRPPLSSATPNGKSRRLNLKPILKKTSSHSPVVTRRKVSFQSDSSPSAASHFPRLSSVVARREEKKRPIDIDSYYQPPPVVPNLTLLDPEKLTVCLDLDETLIHSELIYPKSSSAADFAELVQQTSSLKDSTAKRHGGRSMLNPAHSFVMAGKQGAVAIHVYVRPGLSSFLRSLAKFANIIVFTASSRSYADAVIQCIDPRGHIQHRLYRGSCVQYRGHKFVKDLRVLGICPARAVLLDNSPNAMLASYTQCLPMTNFYFSAQDDELRKALLHLKMMAKHADARVYLKNFNVEKYTEPILNAGPQPVQL